jgi:hypothetical protein
MHGNACTKHPRDESRSRCMHCKRAGDRRYTQACRDARRKLMAIEAALAV